MTYVSVGKKLDSFALTLKQNVLIVITKDFSLLAFPAIFLKYDLLQPYIILQEHCVFSHAPLSLPNDASYLETELR